MTTNQTLAKIRTKIKSLKKEDRIEVFWVDAGDLDTSENFTWMDQKEAVR